MGFLDELMDSTKELESPTNFWYWSGLAAISAVIQDNVWLGRGEMKDSTATFYNTYPNIYVMLHADSGLKKGPPVALAKNLVGRVKGIKIISGRSSVQGMLLELGTQQSETEPGGKIKINKSAAFIASSEFSSSIVEDKAAMTILTDLYDRNWNEGDWRSLLKSEKFTLKDPIITLLVATNEAHFDDFIGLKDVNGGFIGRMFVIAERHTATLNPLIYELEKVPNREELAKYLIELNKLRGPFASLRESAAGKTYHDWYMEFYKSIHEHKIADDTGTIQRFGESVLKVAMLLALSKSPTLVIDNLTMLEAISKCEQLIGNVRRTTMGKRGKATNVHLKNLILNEILNREPHMITREMLMKKYWMHYNSAEELGEIMKDFGQMNLIKVENRGETVIYVMDDAVAQGIKDHLMGKKE